MLDANTKKACKDDPSIREIKIRNIEHAIEQAELMIKESLKGLLLLRLLNHFCFLHLIS